MRKIGVFLLIFSLAMMNANSGFAQSDTSFYKTAKNAVKAGDNDYAFMCFRSIVESTKKSKYYKEALFATGEYYYSLGDYRSAEEAFSNFIDSYAQDQALPFAVIYLLKISNQMYISKTQEDLRKQIITFKQLSLLFREFKECSYISPMNLHYKAIYFIDCIEIYINEGLFEKIYF